MFKSTCVAKADKSGCEDSPAASCASYTGTGLTHYYCNGMLNTCTVNTARTACVDQKATCSAFSVVNCGYAANEGECMVSNGACV